MANRRVTFKTRQEAIGEDLRESKHRKEPRLGKLSLEKAEKSLRFGLKVRVSGSGTLGFGEALWRVAKRGEEIRDLQTLATASSRTRFPAHWAFTGSKGELPREHYQDRRSRFDVAAGYSSILLLISVVFRGGLRHLGGLASEGVPEIFFR